MKSAVTTTTTAGTLSPSSPSLSSSSLVPIRLDIISDDKSLRIVDTLLLDPNCWPIPLSDPIEDSMENNVQELAYSILTDMEVQGMGRTSRHFTGRVELWNLSLENKLMDQLRTQLWSIYHNHNSDAVAAKLRLQLESRRGEKRKLYSNEDSQQNQKQPKMDLQKTMQAWRTTAPDHQNHQQQLQQQQQQQQQSSPSPKLQLYHDDDCIPIKIRLTIHNVRIHEDFLWDPTVPNQCPISLAKSMGDDLNLSDEAVVAIATSIVEQLNGLSLESDDAKKQQHNNPHLLRSPASICSNDIVARTAAGAATTTYGIDIPADVRDACAAAWTIDQRLQYSNIAHLTSVYRPK